MLLAVAIFSLTLLRQTTNPTGTHTDEIFAILSGICLLGSSTSADAALDNRQATIWQRVKFLRLGYPLFCGTIAVLMAAVPILYAETQGRPLSKCLYFLFWLTGISVGVKPMVYKEPFQEYFLTTVMGVLSAATFYFLYRLTHQVPLPNGPAPRPWF
jgi:hypothetical protein